MLGGFPTDLLVTVTLIFLTRSGTHSCFFFFFFFGTFDGVLFRFMAPCNYILAKTCSSSEALSTFSVEVLSDHDGNSSLPAVQRVIVTVGNDRVSLLKRQTHRVVVNGIWRNLPLSFRSKTIKIKSNQAAVVLETRFGLSVSYDNAGDVHISLPSVYSEKVCGLCGNFNHLQEDDLRNPDGAPAHDATDLANSWQSGQTNSTCDTILVPHQCDPVEETEYGNELNCGALLSSSGPFAACRSVLGAESYFRGCLNKMCSAHGDPSVLCETLGKYADTCGDAGVAVPAWWNSTICPPQCGENSQHNSCAKGCPDACSGEDIVGSCGSCEERCECDEGFKLSGGKCVPVEECGCWHKGKHYERGQTILEGECLQLCQCMGGNNIQCTKMQCARSEVCKVEDGVKGCFPIEPATCSVYGDPHYVTFDGMAYDFQGGCSYTLATTCGAGSSVHFTVTGHNMHPPLHNFTWSKLDAVTLQIEDLHLTLNQSAKVNTTYVRLPYSIAASYGSVWIYENNSYVVLETTFGLRMVVDGQNRLFLQVDDSYKYQLCGLCGTYSEQQDDDFIKPSGQNATEPFEFADSWRAPHNNGCVSHPNDPQRCENEEEENEAYTECFAILGAPFKPCHETIHPSVYINSCVHDYCAASRNQHALCESIQSYAVACRVAGVALPDWPTAESQTTENPPITSPSPTLPSQTPEPASCPLNCDFEKNLCGWQQLIQDTFDWTRYSGATPTIGSGPNHDHTTGAGFYMYIEGDSATQGDPARLLSSECHYSGPVCLQFWYHMYGSATAMTLNMYLLQGNIATKIWSIKNNHGQEWHLGQVDIDVFSPFQIIVEGIRGSDARSDVAIDDISIQFDSCSSSLGGGPPLTTEVLPSDPVCSLNCSFDQNFCAWKQMMTDAFDWTWQSGSTPTLMTGPSSDHTGDGHYLYIEASTVSHGDTARLISSECADSGSHCLQFWYHMYGSADTMGLHLYLLQDKKADAIWWKRNDQGNMWHLAQVDLTVAGAFQIIFEGRRGSNEQSDVAIDDISLFSGQVTPPMTYADTTTKPTPLTTERTAGPPSTTSSEPQPPNATTEPQSTMTHKPQHPNASQPATTGRPQPPTTPESSERSEQLNPMPAKNNYPAPPCQRNSHYSACIPACGPTCRFLNGPPHCNDSGVCEPGCVCDDGYVLKRGVCVPIRQCGCVDRDGNKYTVVWYTKHCRHKCRCEKEEDGAEIECDEEECDGNDVCLQNEEGHYYCQKTGFDECRINGDPGYRTFDNMKHDFEGEHSYVLVRTRNLPINLQDVYIEGINTPDDDDDDDDDDDQSREDDDDEDESNDHEEHHRLQSLKIKVYNHTVEFKKLQKLFVDGRRTKTPVSPSLGLNIRKHSSHIYLTTDFGLSVKFDGHSDAEITLPRTYKRKVGGLCGNFDGRILNDRMKPDGTVAKSVQEFGESWRV
uniref:Zonadhesin n=1 Tax=Hippocampus comes TaxID=109280 RepID=A0A3Q2YGD5_HIPCM